MKPNTLNLPAGAPLPTSLKNPTRAEAIAYADRFLSERIAAHLAPFMETAAGVNPNAAAPPKRPGPGLKWVRVDDDVLAREAARCAAWKAAEMSRLVRFLDAEGDA